MKSMKSNITILLLFCAFSLSAQNFQVSNSEISIAGTSTLHDWVSSLTEVTGTSTMTFEAGVLKQITDLNLTFAVEGIKSTKGKKMDTKTYDALLSSTYPNITYRLKNVASLHPNSNGVTIVASGDLTVAGTTKSINLLVTGTYGEENSIQFEGSKSFNMTDFGVEPPTALLGTLHTGDKVTINFSVNFKALDTAAFRN